MTTLSHLKELKGLKLIHLNCRSILNKIDEISYTFGDIDILACTETWLYRSIPDHMVAIPSMHLFRHDRDNASMDGNVKTRGGGVACYISTNLKINVNTVPIHSHISVNIEILTLKCVYIFGKTIHIMIVYRPPNRSCQELFNTLTSYIEDGVLTESDLYICGDFNIDYLQRSNPKTKTLITFLRSPGLKQHIQTATRLTGYFRTCIEFIITNIPDTPINAVEVLCEAFSDHYAVFCDIL